MNQITNGCSPQVVHDCSRKMFKEVILTRIWSVDFRKSFFIFHIWCFSYELLTLIQMLDNVFSYRVYIILRYGASVGSDTRPQVSAFLSNGSGNGWSLHFTFVIHDDARIILEVDEDSISSTERFALSNDDGGHDLKHDLVTLARHFKVFHKRRQLTFFLSSGLPFLTVATNISPTPAAGKRFRRPRIPWTAMTYKFLPPERIKWTKFCHFHQRSSLRNFLINYLYYRRSSLRLRLGKPAKCGIYLRLIHHDLKRRKKSISFLTQTNFCFLL